MKELMLVTNENGRAMTTSLKIAEVFGKEHKDVLKKIREKSNLFTERNFSLSDYEDSTGRKLPMYLLDRDFTTFLIMGFTGSKADEFKMKYIEAFNQMEDTIKNLTISFDNRTKAIMDIMNASNDIEKVAALKSFEEVITTPLLDTIEEQKPKADYYDELVDREHLTGIRDTAKELHIKERVFINWLLDNNYLYRDAKNILKPYSTKMDLFAEKDFKNKNNKHSGVRTLITLKGKDFFRKACVGLKVDA